MRLHFNNRPPRNPGVGAPAPPLQDGRRLGPQALRHEPRAELDRPAHGGATPVADHPVQSFGTTRKVTNLKQDLTYCLDRVWSAFSPADRANGRCRVFHPVLFRFRGPCLHGSKPRKQVPSVCLGHSANPNEPSHQRVESEQAVEDVLPPGTTLELQLVGYRDSVCLEALPDELASDQEPGIVDSGWNTVGRLAQRLARLLYT
jgi:hypothetical protein